MTSFILTSQAERDLDQILDCLVRDSMEAAARVWDALEEAFDKLAKMPHIGHYREDLTDKSISSSRFIHI